MSAEQAPPRPEQPAPVAPPPGDPATARLVRGYRIMTYVSVLVAVAALGLVWKVMNRPVVEDLAVHTLDRDKQYPFVVDAYGFKYQGHTGNVIDEYILRYGAWEKDHLFFVRDYLKNLNEPNAVVIDVGANTGHHTLFYSRHAARVLAFEPFPPVIATFKQNLALNPHVTNVELCEVGLGDANAELPFSAPADLNHGQGTFRVGAPMNPAMKQLDKKLQIVIGDEYLRDKNLGPVAFIKVDIEGFEEAALKGLRQTMDKYRPLLEVEVTPPPTGTIDSLDKLTALFPKDYEFYVLLRSNDGTIKGQYHLVKLDWAVHSRNEQIELVACPKERLAAMPGK